MELLLALIDPIQPHGIRINYTIINESSFRQEYCKHPFPLALWKCAEVIRSDLLCLQSTCQPKPTPPRGCSGTTNTAQLSEGQFH